MDIKIQKKLEKFFSKFKNQNFKKGDILIKPDHPPSGIFCLKEGMVKQYSISTNGEELILNIYKPISLFPMSYAINNTLPQHYYEAMTPVSAWSAPKEDTLKFIRKNADVLLDLLSRIYKGLEGFFLRMENLMAGSARAKLITTLLIYAKRFGKVKITEKDLAAQSGITRETVSREMQKLKEKGLLNFQKSTLTIYDLQRLEKELIATTI